MIGRCEFFLRINKTIIVSDSSKAQTVYLFEDKILYKYMKLNYFL